VPGLYRNWDLVPEEPYKDNVSFTKYNELWNNIDKDNNVRNWDLIPEEPYKDNVSCHSQYKEMKKNGDMDNNVNILYEAFQIRACL